MPTRLVSSPRVYICTLGCPKNEADAWRLRRVLVCAGARLVDDPEKATHIVVVTCGFIKEAKEESIAAILEACEEYPGAKVVVAGCLVQRYPRELQEGLPEVTAWFGLLEDLEEAAFLEALGLPVGFGSSETAGVPSLPQRERPYAYLKISDGCDEPCTFCAIPAIKGPYRALSAQDILKEADVCLAQGARELVLVGQDTAVWRDGELDLAGLVDLLARDERVAWLRLLYLQPEHVDPSLCARLASQPKWCRYLDLPFQHSHPDVLRAMGRSGDGAKNLALLREIRRIVPDVVFRSTFIVGFPGETEEQFAHLLAFVGEAEFDYAGGFIYSPEEGTPASRLRPRVRKAVAVGRLNRLTARLQECSEQRRRALLGSRTLVMLEVLDPEELPKGVVAIGRTRGQAPEVDGVTYVEGVLPRGAKVGDLVEVTIEAVAGYDLVAVCDGA